MAYLQLQESKGSLVRTDLLLKGKKFKTAVVQTFQPLLAGWDLAYDEQDLTIRVVGVSIHPLYHGSTYHVGHVILTQDKATRVIIGHHTASFRCKESSSPPKMKLTWQDETLIVLEDRRRGIVTVFTPSEVKRDDWN